MIKKDKLAISFLFITTLFPLLIILFYNLHYFFEKIISAYSLNSIITSSYFQNFCTVFLSIVLEALPFIILGTLISSLIQIFVSEETIARLIPKNKFLSTFIAATIGLIFPVCDCAVIPIVRRLLKKGVPLHAAITFMLAVPIVNPIVLSSTYYAFYNKPVVVLLRGTLGLLAAMIIGNIIGTMEENNNIFKNNEHLSFHEEDCCHHDHEHHHSVNSKDRSPISIIFEVLEHTSIEFHDVGRFLIAGAFLSSLAQTFIPRKYILYFGKNNLYSVLIMIVLAFFLAICSQTDAFIARTFLEQFTFGSIIAFLIFGPMIDIKNTLMLSSSFKAGFIIKLIFIIFSVCFILGNIINFVLYRVIAYV